MVRRRIRIEALLLFLLLMTAGCQSGTQPEQGYETTQATQGVKAETEEPYSENIFAMDTYMTVTAYGEHARKAVEEGVAEIERLDALLSTGKEDSEIAKLNESGSKVVSSDTQYLFSRSVELYKETAGCFNIAIYPVMEAWGFEDGTKTEGSTGTEDSTKTDDNKSATAETKTQTITVKKTSASYKASALKKAKKTFKIGVSATGTVNVTKTSGNSRITVNKAGKVTVKKGLKKGTYKVKVKISAAAVTKGSVNYKKAEKTVTLKIKVK